MVAGVGHVLCHRLGLGEYIIQHPQSQHPRVKAREMVHVCGRGPRVPTILLTKEGHV